MALSRVTPIAPILFPRLVLEQVRPSVAYTGIVLSEASRTKLLRTLEGIMRGMEGWERVAHHLTLNMGPYKGDKAALGKSVKLRVTSWLVNDKVGAVGVEILDPTLVCQNAHPHITVVVNRGAGGKPVMSNSLPWDDESQTVTINVALEGTVEEVAK